VTYDEFADVAHRMWEEVPSHYKRGVDGVVVRPEAETHPEHEDYFTMGLCSTEPFPSGYGGPETDRSTLVLYYGSFRELSRSDPDFDWEEELCETITHELRHHLEFMVAGDDLDGVDYVMEQSHRRDEGLSFDPWYFQSGIVTAPGVYQAEREVFIEQVWAPSEFERREKLEFDWEGNRWAIPRPERLGDLHYVRVTGPVESPGSLHLALVRETSFWRRIRELGRRTPLELLESEAEARVVAGDTE